MVLWKNYGAMEKTMVQYRELWNFNLQYLWISVLSTQLYDIWYIVTLHVCSCSDQFKFIFFSMVLILKPFFHLVLIVLVECRLQKISPWCHLSNCISVHLETFPPLSCIKSGLCSPPDNSSKFQIIIRLVFWFFLYRILHFVATAWPANIIQVNMILHLPEALITQASIYWNWLLHSSNRNSFDYSMYSLFQCLRSRGRGTWRVFVSIHVLQLMTDLLQTGTTS